MTRGRSREYSVGGERGSAFLSNGKNDMRVEICIDSPASAVAAQQGGAHRVELCDNLFEGGTTPSAGSIKVTRSAVGIGLHVLIRPRGGDFLYSPMEMEVMLDDIRLCRELGANGVVIGCLAPDGAVDVEKTRRLKEAAGPLSVTFHRAFDMCRDPFEALEELVGLGIDRLLTSGQEATCMEGLELIAELHRRAAGRIIIMPGGGITPRNVRKLVAGTGVGEVHLSARRTVESGMTFRNPCAFMGGALRLPEYSWKMADADAIRSVVGSLPRTLP